MKKSLLAAAAALALVTSSCGTGMLGQGAGLGGSSNGSMTGSQGGSTGGNYLGGQGGSGSLLGSGNGMLGSLLNTIIGNATPLTPQSLYGTWKYTSPEVRFESENFLAKAGGEVGAAKVEQDLVKVYSAIGISKGNTSVTFNQDGTCVMQIGRLPIQGTYTLDAKNNNLTMVFTGGLVTLNAKVYNSLGNLIILFDAHKLLNVVQALSSFTGKGGSTLSTISSIAGQYDGLMLGMNMSK